MRSELVVGRGRIDLGGIDAGPVAGGRRVLLLGVDQRGGVVGGVLCRVLRVGHVHHLSGDDHAEDHAEEKAAVQEPVLPSGETN